MDAATAAEIRDASGMAIDADTFFSLLDEGDVVSVQDALFDGVSRLDNGKIELED